MKEDHAMIRFFSEVAQSARRAAVKMAQEARVCRLCLKEPTIPTVLNMGEEYACQICLRDHNRSN